MISDLFTQSKRSVIISYMNQPITAIYEGGVLRPLKPLRLDERQEVLIQIIPASGNDEVDRITSDLVLAGELTLPSPVNDIDSITDEELVELAKQVAESMDKPLSEIIIEERGEW